MWLDLCYRALLDATLLWLEKYFILWICSTRSLFGDLCSSDMEQVVTCCKCSFSGLKSKWDELFHKILIMLCNFLQQKICFFHPWFTECWVLRCCRILLRQTTLIKKMPRFKLFPYCICFLMFVNWWSILISAHSLMLERERHWLIMHSWWLYLSCLLLLHILYEILIVSTAR